MTGDLSSLYQAAQSLMQNYDIDQIVQKEIQENLQEKLAKLIDVKVDRQASQQTRVATEQHRTSKSKMKKKAESLKKLSKAKKAEKVKEVKEVASKKEIAFDEQLTELREKALPQDEKLNRYENARFVMDLAEDPKTQADDIIEYLIQPTGPYGKRPDEADKCLKLAIQDTEQQVKMLTAKEASDKDIAAAKRKLSNLQNANTKLMSHIDTDISSQYTGTSVGRTIIYKSKIRQDTLKQIPLFANEAEFKQAMAELDGLTDPTSHYQWCSKYDYKQILAIYNEYARETSEILNSAGETIEPGLLYNRLKVLQNNTSFKMVNRVFGNELSWGMWQWSRDIGSKETSVS